MGWTGCFPAGIVFKDYTATPEKQLHDGYHHKTGPAFECGATGGMLSLLRKYLKILLAFQYLQSRSFSVVGI
jgi:hypothetical protein